MLGVLFILGRVLPALRIAGLGDAPASHRPRGTRERARARTGGRGGGRGGGAPVTTGIVEARTTATSGSRARRARGTRRYLGSWGSATVAGPGACRGAARAGLLGPHLRQLRRRRQRRRPACTRWASSRPTPSRSSTRSSFERAHVVGTKAAWSRRSWRSRTRSASTVSASPARRRAASLVPDAAADQC